MLHTPEPDQLPQVFVVNVFGAGPGGGNPAPIVVNASGMDAGAMRALAAHYGHESAFVLPGRNDCDFHFRFFVPNHEMEMCGHATLGATWLLDRLGLSPLRAISISTLSGPVRAQVDVAGVRVSQPRGQVCAIDDISGILDVLGLQPSDLQDFPVVNAATSRVKTLVPLRSLEKLNALLPDQERIPDLCDAIDSTGLYPFAAVDQSKATFSARQFPRSSGYPEDAATGIAASALAWSLRELGATSADRVVVRQGEAMNRPSEIVVMLDRDQCWISGRVELLEEPI